MIRPLCPICKRNPVGINYTKNDIIHYRSKCYNCLQKNKQLIKKMLWELSGYKKKNKCGRCGFISNVPAVFSVYFVDGNMKNTKPNNLITICSNCQILIRFTESLWRPGDIIADF